MDSSNFPSELRLVSMNIHGRFKGREIKEYGQLIIRYILNEKTAAMLFGQQTNFVPDLQNNYEYMGGTRAFILYDTTQLDAGDEKHYKLYLRDLELQGRLPKNYLPENNFVISKMRTKSWPCMEFIAISFHTDECFGKLRSTSLFRKLCVFLENLLEIEEMPILVSGSFRINLEDAKKIVPDGFRCCSYIPSTRKRSLRQSNFYICTRSLVMNDVRPMVCGKMDVADHVNGSLRKFINPEDIFYWDPVAAYMREKDQGKVWENIQPSVRNDKLPQKPAVPNRFGFIKRQESVTRKETVSKEDDIANRFEFIMEDTPSPDGKKRTGALKLKPYYEALKCINASLSPEKSTESEQEDLLSASQDDVQSKSQIPSRTKISHGRWQESKDSLLSLSGESQCSSDLNLSSSQDLPCTRAENDLPEETSPEYKHKDQLKKAASFVELYDEELVNNSGVCYMQ